jgi:hypothetical protein
MALTANSSLWVWGNNAQGQLGDGTTTSRNTPYEISTEADWNFIAAGESHTLAVKNNGTLWAWGNNPDGRLGIGSTVNRSVPTRVGTGVSWRRVFAGSAHSIGITQDSSVWTWGLNTNGQLGDNSTTTRLSPVLVFGSPKSLQGDAGANSNHILQSRGWLQAWGQNSGNQIGYSTTTQRNIPVIINKRSVEVFSGSATVNTNPVATLSPAGSISICQSQPVTLTASAGASYLWNTGDTSASILVSNSGPYSVEIFNINGCSTVSNVTTVTSTPFTANVVPTHVSCFGQNNGSANLTVTQGSGNYTYTWSNGSTTEDITGGLTAGTYSVSIQDVGSSCSLTLPVVISQPANIQMTPVTQPETYPGSSNGRVCVPRRISPCRANFATSAFSVDGAPG